MLDPAIIEKVLGSYFKHNENLEIESISEGLTNYNYKIRIETGKQYFLKIFRSANLNRVKGISNLIQILRDYNFPTPQIIKTKEQMPYWTDNEKSAIMTEYITGRYPEKNIPNLYQIGNVLAALHQIPPKIPLDKGYPLNYENQTSLIFKSGQKIENDLQQFIERTLPFINKIINLEFPVSIIHGDVFLDNLLLTELGDIYFIDFEGGCMDKSIFDLSRAVIGCAVIHNRIDLNLAKALITGYDLVRNLEPIEEQNLYEYIIYAGVVSTLWRYNEFNIKRTTEKKDHLYRKLMNPVTEFLTIPREYFQNKIFSEDI